MSEQELVRFTPNLLTVQQVSALLALTSQWHDVHCAQVGADQFGIVGPTQRHALVLLEAHGGGR